MAIVINSDVEHSNNKKLSVCSRVAFFVGVIVAYVGLGFLTGFHWLVLNSYSNAISTNTTVAPSSDLTKKYSKENDHNNSHKTANSTSKKSAFLHAASYWGATLVLGVGGGWCRSGTYTHCSQNETMSHHCLFHEQKMDYRIIYTMHFIGLTWCLLHWIVDGIHLPTMLLQIAWSRKPTVLLGSTDITAKSYWCMTVAAASMAVLSWTLFVPEWTTADGGVKPLVDFVTVALPSTIIAFMIGIKIQERCFPKKENPGFHRGGSDMDDTSLIVA